MNIHAAGRTANRGCLSGHLRKLWAHKQSRPRRARARPPLSLAESSSDKDG